MSAFIPSQPHSWRSSGENASLIARRSLAFLLPSIKRRLRHYARRFLKTCALDRWRRRKKPGDCGIDRGTAGSSSTWMAPGKLLANVLCPVHPIFHRHSVGWMRSVRRATGGAQAGRDGENPNGGAPGPHASMARHVFRGIRSRQRRLPRRAAAGGESEKSGM
jgi:hypothetical protein